MAKTIRTAPTDQQSPLSAEHQHQIASARRRVRKVRRAVAVARFDAWTMAVISIAMLSCVFISAAWDGLSWPSVMLGCGTALVTYNSFRGARLLSRYDVGAPRALAMNQILLAAMIIAYSLCQIASSLTTSLVQVYPELATIQGNPEFADMLGMDIDTLVRNISLLFYGAVIIGSILAQGGAAAYYFTRTRHVQAFRLQTPQWVVDLLVMETA